jgi:hypothetical protein
MTAMTLGGGEQIVIRGTDAARVLMVIVSDVNGFHRPESARR